MSDELDALAESARNRGLKLVRSRVRTPGKGDYGKVALADASGRAVFGMDGKTLTATPTEAERYLRGLLMADWSDSLGQKATPKKPKIVAKAAAASQVEFDPPPEPEPPTEPEPPPEPAPAVRDARLADAPALVALIKLLGHDVDDAGVRERIARLAKVGEPLLVATLEERVVGLCGIHRMLVVHRASPVGRITILAVAEEIRGRGIGRLLVERAELALGNAGCGLIEVTSNDRLSRAHAFYRHIGFERTSMRFVKLIAPVP